MQVYGIGLVGEFVRTGLDWDPWDKNCEGVALPGGKDKMLMDLTITGIWWYVWLKRLLDYALELDVKIETKECLHSV